MTGGRHVTHIATEDRTPRWSFTAVRQGLLSRCGLGIPRVGTTSPTKTSRTPCGTAIRRVEMDDELTMLIGPATDGALLEIGILDLDGDDPVVIHAMALRPKFYRLLG